MLTPEVLRVALAYMEGLNCARSLSAAIMLRYNEYDQLVRMRADQRDYCDADSYRRAAAATDFLRKYDGFALKNSAGGNLDLEAEAIEKWFWSEKQCFEANRRLGRLISNMSLGTCNDERIYEFVHRVRKNVLDVIGPRPPTTWEGRFGPGATVSDKSSMSTIPDKMTSSPTLTPNALFHLVPWTGTAWARASAQLGKSPLVVKGNTFFTVPKDSTSLRGCGKEPSINVFYQLGLGRVMKKRLKAVGIDLTGGKAVHMQVACEASKTSGFSTIDLTSASDCLASNLVKLLLPPAWFEALDSLRSPKTEVNGKVYLLEKFSSMGNGFTFELETLIFACTAQAVAQCHGLLGVFGVDTWAYGDDIIVATSVAQDVIAALKFFGFTPNMKKTFLEGPFRESCGGDYWDGMAVRPHYLKEPPDEPQQFITLANGIRRLAGQDPTGALWADLRPAWFATLDAIPSQIRAIRGPEALGDLVIHDEERYWVTRWRGQIRYLRCYRPAVYRKVRWEGFGYEVQMATALYGVYLQGPTTLTDRGLDQRFLVPRDGVLGYKLGWLPFS